MAVFIELTAQDRARKRAHFWLMSIPSKSPACQSIRPADRCQCGWGNWYSHSRSYIAVSNFDNHFLHKSVVFWSTTPNKLHDTGTMLNTSFVSSSQLAAIVPADLFKIRSRFKSLSSPTT